VKKITKKSVKKFAESLGSILGVLIFVYNLNETATPQNFRIMTKQINKSAIFTLANKLAKSLGRSEALKLAYKLGKDFNLKIVTFRKLDGTITTRVVIREWADVVSPKGGRPVKDGQVVFADMQKYAIGDHPIISTYTNRILKIA
jgi:hypothetical protein